MNYKKILTIAMILLCVLLCAACATAATESNDLAMTSHSGAIGSFALTAPQRDGVVDSVPTFRWTPADNADCYVLEVCSADTFAQNERVFVRKTGIVGTSFTVGANLKDKNVYYYWRVTAVNADSRAVCEGGAGKFYYRANTDEEVVFDTDFADEWTVHPQGSAATVTVNDNNFFGNDKSTLTVSFVEEDTHRGVDESDGWIVVTHQQETEMYGVDAFYFNFYYCGDDADVYLRVVDEDNEYWNAQIKLARNAKQNVIIRFDEFTLRTKGGTIIANQVFDYNYVKYIELVFERSFGNGVAMISDLKAVNYAKYGHLFIDTFDFSSVDESQYIFENYTGFDTVVSDDGSAFTFSFGGDVKGYAFVKMPVNKLLVQGDAFHVRMAYTGGSSSATILFRVIEEDGDRWVYRQKVSELTDEGMVVPYAAFTLSEYNGDGARQFYYLKQIQLGFEGLYSAGSITFADLQVVTLAEEVENLYEGTMSEEGVIDDFNGYDRSVDVYYVWQTSTENKDEYMALDKANAYGLNNTCVAFYYKSDMTPAYYGVRFAGKEGFNALQLWAYDTSVLYENAMFRHLKDARAQLLISLFDQEGHEYTYSIGKLAELWTKYTILLSDFRSDGEDLQSENIAGLKIGMQYYYRLADGSAYPVYTSSNVVYFDNFALVNAEATAVTEVAHKLVPTAEDANVCLADDFDGYTENTIGWKDNCGYDYADLSLSQETASRQGQSLKMQYKGNSTSVSYALSTLIDESVVGKALRLKLKGDDKATVYINLYVRYAGSTYKYRATLSAVSSDWTEYTVGFDNFVKIEGTGNVILSSKLVPYITMITFGIVNNKDSDVSCVYADDIYFDANVGYTANTAIKVGD